MESGLNVDLLIGHSIGQLTALCVSDSIPLPMALSLVQDRATMIQNHWGSEKGAMLAVKLKMEDLIPLISETNQDPGLKVDIACFNGPTAYVLAGSDASIRHIESMMRARDDVLGTDVSRRLEVTHGFHSKFLDDILPQLTERALMIDFQKPKIPIETCSEVESWRRIDGSAVARHSREPVFFSNAVERIARSHGACNWIEAGSGSGITSMARNALNVPERAVHRFHKMNLESQDPLQGLADTVVNLWNSGCRVQFWPYHRLQSPLYWQGCLPPYQFDRSRHWLPYREDDRLISATGSPSLLSMVSLMRPQTFDETIAEFTIARDSKDYKDLVNGHKVLGTALCPASLYLHVVGRAVAELRLLNSRDILQGSLVVEKLEMQLPLGVESHNSIILNLRSLDRKPYHWSFYISTFTESTTPERLTHVKGIVHLQQDVNVNPLAKRSTSSMPSQDSTETCISGSFIYKIFSKMVEYADFMQGVLKITCKDTEIVGLVSLPVTQHAPESKNELTICDPVAIDNFLQVAGFYINFLLQDQSNIVYVCSHIEEFKHHDWARKQHHGPWIISCKRMVRDGNRMTCDILAIETRTEKAAVTIAGACFVGVPTSSLSTTLSSLESGKETSHKGVPQRMKQTKTHRWPVESNAKTWAEADVHSRHPSFYGSVEPPEHQEPKDECFTQLCQLLSDMTDVPRDEMQPESRLELIGVDSLMTIEALGEIERVFHMKILVSDFDRMENLGSLCSYIKANSPKVFEAGDCSEARSPAQPGTVDAPVASSPNRPVSIPPSPPVPVQSSRARRLQNALEAVWAQQDCILRETHLASFTRHVHPQMAKLGVQYIVEAFEELGCSLSAIPEGGAIDLQCLSGRKQLLCQLYSILEHASLLQSQGTQMVRSGVPVSREPSIEILQKVLSEFPRHHSETALLGRMGPHLGACLSGKGDPLRLLFGDTAAKELITEVYTDSPVFAAGTRLLVTFLLELLSSETWPNPLNILEVGGGVGATTRSVIDMLEGIGRAFEYTFTDISSSLVITAETRFPNMKDKMIFQVLDIETEPDDITVGYYDIIISTNAIHATKSLKQSCRNVHNMLRKDGVFCLVELTRNVEAYDIVFGQLDGWWRFEDGRTHPLADIECWKKSLYDAKFLNINWTGSDESEDSDLIRLITASGICEDPDAREGGKGKPTTMETIMFKEVDRTPLYADIYYPEEIVQSKCQRPIGKPLSSCCTFLFHLNDQD